MPPLSILKPLVRHAGLLLVAVLVLACGFRSAPTALADEPLSDAVGIIDGAAIAVNGPMRVEVKGGFTRTILRSGSDVRVQSGVARLELVEGGTISICGPAHFSVLKSAGALTLALETGTIHAQIEREPALTIYTPQIQAHTIAVGDSPQDVVVGFETPGTMCLRANRGAIRIEHQLSGQTVIIPQGGEVQLVDGQIENLRSDFGHCACELQVANAAEPPPEVSQIATAEEARKSMVAVQPDSRSDAAEKAPAKEEAIYQVYMPPLVYDARAKVQPEVDPKMILLVRRVRVRPALIFQGRVKGETVVVAAASPPSKPEGPAPASAKPVAAPSDSFVDRMRSFVRKLWSR